MTPEGKVKKIICLGLAELGILPMTKALAAVKAHTHMIGYFFMPAGTGMGEAGVADILVCLNGKYIEIEVKAAKGKQSGIQKAHQDVIEAAGGEYALIMGEGGAIEFLEALHKKVARINV